MLPPVYSIGTGATDKIRLTTELKEGKSHDDN